MIIIHNTKRGFTLVETLVAVAILMVAIAGPLTIANQALTAALASRNTMVATYLAQEGMESIKNIKDNNVAANQPFYTGIVDPSLITNGGSLINNSKSDPFTTPDLWNSFSRMDCSSVLENCRLYLDDSVGTSKNGYFYDYDSGSYRKTPFIRYYKITTTNSQHEFIATVDVTWMDGPTPNDIQLQELMTDTQRN